MINKKEWNRMMEGKLYNPYKVGSDVVVIASGSVVVKDIPCHVIRQITDKDKKIWNSQLKEYEDDIEK